MFAALSSNLEFFKPRMNGVILIAPVSRVEFMMSPWCQKLKKDKRAFDLFRMTGPEIMTKAAAATFIEQ